MSDFGTYDFSPIVNHIHFLKKNFKLYISLHPICLANSPLFSNELMAFNLHENPYCAFIKHCPAANKHCVDCQKKVIEKCKSGIYNGTCFAGVLERIYPISNRSEVTGFISVSGYKPANLQSYLNRLVHKYDFSKEALTTASHSLNPLFPNDNDLDVLILPLCDMLELAQLKRRAYESTPSLADEIVQYIKQHHTQDITSRDICDHFSCSRSFMSTQFHKFTGKSIRAYINELRIEDAKNLLEHSSLNITEIAFLIGFCNSNYFSEIFKKHTGLSPMQYKKSCR